jgi:hypothetical protein
MKVLKEQKLEDFLKEVLQEKVFSIRIGRKLSHEEWELVFSTMEKVELTLMGRVLKNPWYTVFVDDRGL